MYHFVNDYSETAHPDVMAAIASTVTDQHSGYGADRHCKEAADLIRKHIRQPSAAVHFLVTGTQTNLVAIAASLKPWQAVICPDVGHINVHETGAIEAAGHKVVPVPSPDGKLTPALIDSALRAHSTEHMVEPKMVYISNTTEIGTQYTKAELQALSKFCKERDLLLHLDGARLGSALTSEINDLTMADIAAMVDTFYIGATKNGALFGEALIVMKDELKHGWRFAIKQRGALMAKGWLLGVQFKALFADDLLFYRLGAHSNKMSMILRRGIEACGYRFEAESYSNQQFVVFPRAVLERLESSFLVARQEERPESGEVMLRVCTSWATKEEACHKFVEELKKLTVECIPSQIKECA